MQSAGKIGVFTLVVIRKYIDFRESGAGMLYGEDGRSSDAGLGSDVRIACDCRCERVDIDIKSRDGTAW